MGLKQRNVEQPIPSANQNSLGFYESKSLRFSFEQHPVGAWFDKSWVVFSIIPFKHRNCRELLAGFGINQLRADPAQISGKEAQKGSLGIQPAGKGPPWAEGRKELKEQRN